MSAALSPRQHPPPLPPPLPGLTVLERGWLSSNSVIVHDDAAGAATLIDSGHCLHAGQTIALVRAALGSARLACIINTHLHSDHCGGNAALQCSFAAPLFIPAASWEAVRDWDEQGLGFGAVGQRIERFAAQGSLRDGQQLQLGARCWEVIAAAGHDPDALMLFDRQHGVLISGDALWHDGFGVIFPELVGRPGFAAAAATLERIAKLPLRSVIPGHGPAFADVDAALARARSRLAAFVADPPRHARYAARVLLKYHLMEEQRQAIGPLHLWAGSTPLLGLIWESLGCPRGSIDAWCDELLQQLVAGGAAAFEAGIALNR